MKKLLTVLISLLVLAGCAVKATSCDELISLIEEKGIENVSLDDLKLKKESLSGERVVSYQLSDGQLVTVSFDGKNIDRIILVTPQGEKILKDSASPFSHDSLIISLKDANGREQLLEKYHLTLTHEFSDLGYIVVSLDHEYGEVEYEVLVSDMESEDCVAYVERDYLVIIPDCNLGPC